MEEKNTVPKRLYKYESFSASTIELLVADKVYFADPTKFNDPLDTSPHLDADIDTPALESLLLGMIETRNVQEMEAAAKTIKERSPAVKERIERLGRKRAERLIEDIAYRAEDPEAAGPVDILQSYLEEELLRLYNRAILSLAERHDCPLMWSHYGEQHHGLCLGYQMPEQSVEFRNLHKVRSGGSRSVSAKRVAEMVLAMRWPASRSRKR